MEENKEVLTPEEVKERKEKLTQYYTEQVEFLTVQLEYETLVTQIEEQRAKRLQYQVMVANMLAEEPEEEEVEEKPRGLLSKKKLGEKLPVGSWQIIETQRSDNNDDKFGRILGVFILEDGTKVNDWLIKNNYAVAYKGENKELTQAEHQANKKILMERGEL
jgi:hypothetical protein